MSKHGWSVSSNTCSSDRAQTHLGIQRIVSVVLTFKRSVQGTYTAGTLAIQTGLSVTLSWGNGSIHAVDSGSIICHVVYWEWCRPSLRWTHSLCSTLREQEQHCQPLSQRARPRCSALWNQAESCPERARAIWSKESTILLTMKLCFRYFLLPASFTFSSRAQLPSIYERVV